MRISPHTINAIKQAADIVEVVGDFLPLKKKGANWWALSPFTNEKSPSFSVSPSKGIFKCFSTGKGGDAITFIMEMEGISYVEALKFLANKYGIEIEEQEETPEQQAAHSWKESLYIALGFASKHYQERLSQTNEGISVAMGYFKERKVSAASIDRFELGYSLDQWDDLYKTASKLGYKDDVLEKAGLIVVNEEKRYDRFRGRVMFPIHNVTGRIIGFGARTLKKDEKMGKYINSPESDVYFKSEVLYGIYQAKKAIRNLDNCYLVEGYLDVIAMNQAGVENAVASSGTSLTEQQIQLIKRFTSNVTVLYDGDAAGLKAALRGTDMLLEAGLQVRVVMFPDGHDPDSYIRDHSPEAFQQFIKEQASDFILFKANYYLSTAGNDPIKRAEAVRSIVLSISKVPDAIQRTIFYQQCANLLGVPEELLLEEGNRIALEEHNRQAKQQAFEERRAKQQQTKQDPQQTKPAAPKTPPKAGGFFDDEPIFEDFAPADEGEVGFIDDFEPTISSDAPTVAEPPAKGVEVFILPTDQAIFAQEREHLRLLIAYGDLDVEGAGTVADYLLEEMEGMAFKHSSYKLLLDTYKALHKAGKAPTASVFLAHGNQEVQQTAIALLEDKSMLSPNWAERHKIFVPAKDQSLPDMAYKNIVRLKYRLIRKVRQDVLAKLKNASNDAEVMEQMQLCQTLWEQENELAKILGTVVPDR